VSRLLYMASWRVTWATLTALPLYFCASAVSAGPPAQALSPDAHLSLSPVSAPISAVEVAQGYAKVTRSGRVKVSATGGLIQLPDLPSGAFGVKLKVKGADVLRLTQSQVTRSEVDPKRLTLLTEALEQTTKKVEALQARQQLISDERALITSLSSALSSAEGKAPELTPKTLSLWDELMRLDERVDESITRRALELQAQLTALVPTYQRQLFELESFTSSISQKRALEVLAYLRGASDAERSFELEYLMRGPTWSPAHELHVDSTKSVVRRALIAQVTQRSSEDWSGVKLSVTTNRLLQSPSRPKLLTWTLSEQAQFTPHLVASRSPSRPPLYPKPQPQAQAQDPRQQLTASLLTRANGAKNTARHYLQKAGIKSLNIGGSLKGGGGSAGYGRGGLSSDSRGSAVAQRSAANRRSRRQARPSPSRSPSRSYREPQPSLAPPPPAPPAPPYDAPSAPAALEADEAPQMSYLEDAPASKRSARRRPGFGFDDLTRYQAPSGALKPRYTFTAPSPAVIPSNSQPVSIPLMVKESPVTLVYEVTPDLSPYAYLTGKAKHSEKLPILRGPARLFSDGGYVGEAQLNETLQGELWTVPLGADPELKVKRHLEVKTVTKGLISKDEVSTYQVKIQVANYKRRRVSLKVYDALPVSETDEVEVTLMRMNPKAELSDPKEGLLTWTLDLKAGERRELLLTYSIKRPKGWRVYQ